MELSREQFVNQVLEIVQARFPLERIVAAEQPFSLKINGYVASLENLYRIAQLEPTGLRHQAERWVVELLRAVDTPDKSESLDQVRQQILPVIVPEGQGPRGAAVSRPFVPGLAIAYAVDHDRSIMYIMPPQFEGWGITQDELHDLALENLTQRSEEINAHAAQDEEGNVNLIMFQTMDGYDASRLLLPTLHQRLRGFLGSPFAAAIPNRDILLCFRNDADTLARLRPQVTADYNRMPHQITDKLLLVTLDGIAPLDS